MKVQYADSGHITGPSNYDSVPLRFEVGEWVVGADGIGRQVIAIDGDGVHFSEPVRVFDPKTMLDHPPDPTEPEEGDR